VISQGVGADVAPPGQFNETPPTKKEKQCEKSFSV